VKDVLRWYDIHIYKIDDPKYWIPATISASNWLMAQTKMRQRLAEDPELWEGMTFTIAVPADEFRSDGSGKG